MEKLLCKTCGTRHWTREPCPAVKPGKISDVTVLEPVRPVPKRARRRGKVVVVKRAREDSLPLARQQSEAVAPSDGPLSGAERAKRYRERHGDRVREANRLRMAAKRAPRQIGFDPTINSQVPQA